MYEHGHKLPEFAMYPLLDDRRAVADLTDMYTRYLEIAAAHQLVALTGGLDYRASPDWASKLGISADGLAEFQLRFPQIDVWGGCCGTWDDHLRAIAQQLRPLENTD